MQGIKGVLTMAAVIGAAAAAYLLVGQNSSGVELKTPAKLAIDKAGNIYITDTNNATIDKLAPDGKLTLLAGMSGKVGAAGGKGTGARFFGPRGIAIRGDGTLFMTDHNNNVIYKITPDGTASIFAGSPWSSNIADLQTQVATGRLPARGFADGTGANARFNSPEGIAADAAGNLYVADMMNDVIRKITPDGVVTTLAGQPGEKGSADGKGAAARFLAPEGVATDTAGNIYVTDLMNSTIRKITPDGVVSTIAGKAGEHGDADGPATTARFAALQDIAIDAAGNLFVVDSMNHNMRKITPDGVVSTVAGQQSSFSEAYLSLPNGVTIDPAGNMYVTDGDKIVKITLPRTYTIVAHAPRDATR